MIIFIVDVFLVCVLILVAAKLVQKLLNSREGKLKAALDEQKKAAELAKQAEQINTEEILKNQAKVKETLDKLQ